MKNILISFIRNEHLVLHKENNFDDIDISVVVKNKTINRLFLLTNQNREESIDFKNWISEKLDIEVKAVTLEKGSEKYILNKIESIIKYILLAEEGHARFFYLPGENTLQINLWEIVNKNIYRGEIIYPNQWEENSEKEIFPKKERIPVYNNTKEKKIFTVKPASSIPDSDPVEKGSLAIEKGMNLLICGEEGTGKCTLAKSVLVKTGRVHHEVNFRSINPAKMDEEFEKLSEKLKENENIVFLLLNIEVLPHYVQEKFTTLNDFQNITTMNISDSSSTEDLNRKFYYRISNSRINLLPLRSRKKSLSGLIKAIIMNNKSNAVLSDNALEVLQRHNWPGNFNELNSVISRACVETGSIITAQIIENCIDSLESDLKQWQTAAFDENFNLNDILGDVAMHYIMLALEISEGKKSKAAQLLGFSNYQTLSNWIRKYKK